MKHTLFYFAFICSSLISAGQQWHPLYEGRVPNVLKDSVIPADSRFKDDLPQLRDLTHPFLQVFRPVKGKNTGTGLLIFPGGAYGGLVWQEEGVNIAKAFNEKGITCFVVKYRLPNEQLFEHTETVPLTDAVTAMRWVKKHNDQFQLDTSRIGCIGFSAGGHLAATFGNRAPDDARPKFTILVYPVVTMQESLTHMGSRINLLGKQPSKQMVDAYSNEMQVTRKTPPAYITHTGDDGLVPVKNSILMYEALQRLGINAELHVYPRGDHGFVLDLQVAVWRDPMIAWLLNSDLYAPHIYGKGKTVILTFDDASQSHYSVIPPMLKPYDFGATFYVCEFPPDFEDSTKNMTWKQIQSLSRMGYEIGNHTWHHKEVSGLNDSAAESEISYVEMQCKKLGIPRPVSFSYPGRGTDSAFLPVLHRHGYQTARTTGDRPWYAGKDHPYYVPEYCIKGDNPVFFYKALEQAASDNAIVFCVHGVPDVSHPAVSTPPEVFAEYLKYLHDHDFTVTSMKDYIKKSGNDFKKNFKKHIR